MILKRRKYEGEISRANPHWSAGAVGSSERNWEAVIREIRKGKSSDVVKSQEEMGVNIWSNLDLFSYLSFTSVSYPVWHIRKLRLESHR